MKENKIPEPEMVVCPTCGGFDGFNGEKCPICQGTGKVSPPEPVKPLEGLLTIKDKNELLDSITPISKHPTYLLELINNTESKLQPELDRREARIKTLEGEVKAQHETLIKYSSKWESALAEAKAEAYKELITYVD